jgi:predicted esterase YcpF (UPF0227 family)
MSTDFGEDLAENVEQLNEIVRSNYPQLIVGSSMGGLTVLYADAPEAVKVAINPALSIADSVRHTIGLGKHPYFCERMNGTTEFELTEQKKRKRFGVTRERRRKNNVVKATLYEYDETGAKLALAEGAEEVNKKVEDVLGLSFDDFKKCIALPQGEFSSLVKATNAERVKLVARIFDLEKYGDRLSAKIRAKHDFSKGEAEKLLARMGENQTADGEDENSEGARLQELKNMMLRQVPQLYI